MDPRAHVWRFWEKLDTLGPRALSAYCRPDLEWHGFRPFRRLTGIEAVAVHVWEPLRRAIPDLERHPYMFIAGRFEDTEWVCGTGDFSGTFAGPWLGVVSEPRRVRFRFGEFCRVEDGRVTEIRMLIDLPELLRCVGVSLLPAPTGRDEPVRGPAASNGIRLGPPVQGESAASLALVESMIFGGLNRYDGDQGSQQLERFWHPDMVWHGPVGIGTARGLDEFKANAQGPIVAALPDRRGVGHQARLADGRFAASTGWPSLVGTHTGPIFGWEPTGRTTGWNVMDFWRRDGELLRENWVLIDLIDAGLQAGVDLLAQLRE